MVTPSDHLRTLEQVLVELRRSPPAPRAAAAAAMREWLRHDKQSSCSASASSTCLRGCVRLVVPSLLLAWVALVLVQPWQNCAIMKAGKPREVTVLRRLPYPADDSLPVATRLVIPATSGAMTVQSHADQTASMWGAAARRRRADVKASAELFGMQATQKSAPESLLRTSTYPPHGAFTKPLEALRALRPQRNTSDFPLILCVGHGKTATKSLNRALSMLGYGTAHFYGSGVYGLLYSNAASKQDYDFHFELHPVSGKHIDAVLDTPVVDFYNEILLTYPNAKVILTIRGIESWLRSQQRFYCCYAQGCQNWMPPWRRGSNLVFGTECPSTEQAIKRYVQHNRNVFDSVPRDRLLVMDIPGGDGWEKLCAFLGVPIPPNMTFPSRH